MIIMSGSYSVNATNIVTTGMGKITGNIRNAISDLPLGNVTVTLFTNTDSSMVAGTISDNFGNFYISMLDSGKYYLVISETGFNDARINQLRIISSQPKCNVGEVMLSPVAEIRRRHKNK